MLFFYSELGLNMLLYITTIEERQMGFLVVELIALAKKLAYYITSLDCKDTMIPFYEGVGFNKELSNGNFLMIHY